ncbi:hypothetical protein T440DRAFT_470630, partial [Plenodomus tracheiphilus IPT5]
MYNPLSAEDQEKLGNVTSIQTSSAWCVLRRACGWKTQHEQGKPYLPRLRIFHARPNGGLWTRGNDWAIWDRTQEESENDCMTHQFLKKQDMKHVPLLQEMIQFTNEVVRYNFVVMSRAKAAPLERVWGRLSSKERKSYA